jgi:hypothetical protein
MRVLPEKSVKRGLPQGQPLAYTMTAATGCAGFIASPENPEIFKVKSGCRACPASA